MVLIFLNSCFKDRKGCEYKKNKIHQFIDLKCPNDNRISDSILLRNYNFNDYFLGLSDAQLRFRVVLSKYSKIEKDYKRATQILWSGKLGFCSKPCDKTDEGEFILNTTIFDVIKLNTGFLVLNNLEYSSYNQANLYFYYPKSDSIYVICWDDNCVKFNGGYVGYLKKENSKFVYYFMIRDANVSFIRKLNILDLHKIDKTSGAITSKKITDINGVFFSSDINLYCDSVFQNDLTFDWNKWELHVKYQDGRDSVFSLK